MITKHLKKILLAGIVLVGIGCGSAANDDAGTSFSLIGFYKDADGEEGSSGSVASLSTNLNTGVIIAAKLQNNLSGAAIRMSRVRMSFFIAGASAQPPDDTFAMGGILGANGNGNSSLPSGLGGKDDAAAGTGADAGGEGGGGGIETSSINEFAVVPVSTMAWLRNNRGSLPNTPFVMEVYVYAEGTTTAGRGIVSNTAPYFVQFSS